MALLFRFARSNDRANTHLFTFVATRSITRDLQRDVTTKEFSCGNQKWSVAFSRGKNSLGVFLLWKSTSESMRVYLDFTFTLLNRDHFSINEVFTQRQVKFTQECPAQGSKSFIALPDLFDRNFTDLNGEFQLELTIGNVRTVFDTEFRLFPVSPTGHLFIHHPSKMPSKVESSYFIFGGFDWNLTLFPLGDLDPRGIPDGRVSLYLNRCTGFDHQCRVQYSVVLGDGDCRIDSGILEDISDTEGKSYGWHTRMRCTDLIYRGAIRVHLEMMLANTVSQVISNVVQHQMSASSALGIVVQGYTQCYDRDKQGWCIKTDSQSDSVRVHMVYKEIQNVPRNHLRYVSWAAYVVKYSSKKEHELIALPGSPFSHYYYQESSDEGIIMETEVSIDELKDHKCPYVSEKGKFRIHVEWVESYLLFQSTYNGYDDVSKVQSYQMRREICALQAENYNLERQIYSYQKCLERGFSRGTYSDDSPDCKGEEVEKKSYYKKKQYASERSVSTDTEYA